MNNGKYNLSNKKFAILIADGYQRDEFEQPKKALDDAGATVTLIAPETGTVKGWKDGGWSGEAKAEKTPGDVKADDFDGIFIPGGVLNIDKLRVNKEAISLLRSFFVQGKPVAAICHAPALFAEAGVAQDRKLTGHAAIRTEMANAQAKWQEEDVVVDQGLVTSPGPKQLDAFCDKLLEEFKEGIHNKQREKTLA